MYVDLIKNVSIGEIPPTPLIPVTDFGSTKESINFLMETALLGYGYPISYIQEQQGRLVQNILPVFKTETQQISTSSKVELFLHTETAFHPYKPDFVFLLCLRGDDSAITTYAQVDEILSHLDKETIEVLQEDWYITGVDDSFRTKGEPDKKILLSVLKMDSDGSYSMIYDQSIMQGTNPSAEIALKKFDEAVKKSIKEIILETGDLLILNNNKVIHGRKPFQARYDGTDRWVQRMLVVKNLPPKSEINGHTITTDFSK